jgi:hypothetical protein
MFMAGLNSLQKQLQAMPGGAGQICLTYPAKVFLVTTARPLSEVLN